MLPTILETPNVPLLNLCQLTVPDLISPEPLELESCYEVQKCSNTPLETPIITHDNILFVT